MPPLEVRFPKRRAFVTGAGSGLGRALCHELAARGFVIGVQDLRPDRAAETLREVESRGGRGRAFAFDVGDGEAWSRAASSFLAEHGGLDLIVNNAGVAVAAPLLDVSPEDWGSYCVTKYGVVALSETLSLELADSGVGVSVVCPYFFKTRIVHDGRGEERLLSVAEWLIHLGGWTPERIARAVLRGVEKGRLYVLPQPEAKAFWALRRLSPRLFLWAARRVHDFALRRAPDRPMGPKGATA